MNNIKFFDIINKDILGVIAEELSYKDKFTLWTLSPEVSVIKEGLKIYEIDQNKHTNALDHAIDYLDTPLFSNLKIYRFDKFIDLTKFEYLEHISIAGLTQKEVDTFVNLPNLKRLCVSACKTITNLNHLKSVIHLEAITATKLGNDPNNLFDVSVFDKLKLVALNVSYNPYAKNIAFLAPTLKKLYCAESGIEQEDINSFNLTLIDCSNNAYIQNISHMTNLTSVNISGNSAVDQKGIRGLNLKCLNVRNNNKIYDISWMKNLVVLDIRENTKITLSEDFEKPKRLFK